MFDNFISLGLNCLVASALSKYGLRSTSGPFDWCTSSLEGVISLLENEFVDFMDYKNLRVNEENKKIFDDIKYRINYNHEVRVSLDSEYVIIKEKYQRRIERFKIMIKEPTCFVRLVWSIEELSFLKKEEDRICNAIKSCKDNEIIFIVPKYIYEKKPIKTRFKLFLVDTIINGFSFGREEARSLFDTNKNLIDFCINNYNSENRKNNLIFDLTAELMVAKKGNTDIKLEQKINNLKKEILRQRQCNIELESRLERWMYVVNTDYSSIEYVDKIAIYGCGAIGKTLYNYMKKNFYILEFIDKSPRQDMYNNIPINTIEKSISDRDTLIIVVPSYDYDKIRIKLLERFEFSPNIIRMEEFLAKGKVIDPYF